MVCKIKFTITGVVFVVVSLMTVPVYADCAADIKKLDERLLLNVGAGSGLHEKIRSLSHEAKTALKNGKKKMCEKKVKIANGIMDKVGK